MSSERPSRPGPMMEIRMRCCSLWAEYTLVGLGKKRRVKESVHGIEHGVEAME